MANLKIVGNDGKVTELPLPEKAGGFSSGKTGFYLRIQSGIEIDGERFNGQVMLWRAGVPAPKRKSPNVF